VDSDGIAWRVYVIGRTFLQCGRRVLRRFSDAGTHDANHALRRPRRHVRSWQEETSATSNSNGITANITEGGLVVSPNENTIRRYPTQEVSLDAER
jgi:hypothetical protein